MKIYNPTLLCHSGEPFYLFFIAAFLQLQFQAHNTSADLLQ